MHRLVSALSGWGNAGWTSLFSADLPYVPLGLQLLIRGRGLVSHSPLREEQLQAAPRHGLHRERLTLCRGMGLGAESPGCSHFFLLQLWTALASFPRGVSRLPALGGLRQR